MIQKILKTIRRYLCSEVKYQKLYIVQKEKRERRDLQQLLRLNFLQIPLRRIRSFASLKFLFLESKLYRRYSNKYSLSKLILS